LEEAGETATPSTAPWPELFAASIWDGRGQLVVNFPHRLHHQLHQSEVKEFSRECLTPIHAEVHRLRRGRDYDVRPLSASQCRRLGIGEECALCAERDS
jgi:hypothetical protein